MISAGSGALGVALCRNYPEMHVTLLDGELPLKYAKEKFVPKEFGDRISYLQGRVENYEINKIILIPHLCQPLENSEEYLRVARCLMKECLNNYK